MPRESIIRDSNWKCVVVVGAQWGDEGKGKVVDLLTDRVDVVVRAQGGSNAGHTIEVGGEKFVLHLLPSGILRKGVVNVIGNGAVVDLAGLAEEIECLRKRGVEVGRENLLLSESAHLVLPWHRKRDSLREEAQGSNKIGTTRRGIGPTYSDKAIRCGLRVGDLLDWGSFVSKLRPLAEENARILGLRTEELFEEVKGECEAGREIILPFVADTVVWLHGVIKEGKRILFEGAQGTYLDIDHGTYPYVTSSNTTSGGACTGSGVPPTAIDRVLGVMKAYTTRVGGGPFPTESTELGEHLHGLGREFGATTGRARRCGWVDCVMLRQAVQINGFEEFAVTNLDGLDCFEEIPVCVSYELGGERREWPPKRVEEWFACRPVYRFVRGWKCDTSGAKSWEELPKGAREYIHVLEEEIGARCVMVSVGPGREQTIQVERS
ncbi:MAG: adenylosuccinate synthase [Chthoniobacterales bacterium]|nr:adenylosuccinate synthase [Chthoniobacterales bacterium]